MGGVDLLDGLLSYYRIQVKSKKWYNSLIWHFLDIACIQAWLFYQKDAAVAHFMSLKPFKMSITESLLRQRKATRGIPPRSSTDTSHSAKAKKGPAKLIPNRAIRTDGYKHWPEFCKTKGHCQNPECKGIPRVKCTKCNVRLFYNKSQFFQKVSRVNYLIKISIKDR